MSGPSSTRLTVIDYEAIPGVTPEQAALAKRRVAERAHDVDDARRLLEMLFCDPQVRPPRGFRDREPRDPDAYQPCGTEAAYQRHRKRGQRGMEIDEACRKAASQARSESKRRVREQRKAEAANEVTA